MTYLSRKYKIESVKEYTQDVKLFKVRCNLNPKPGSFIEVSIPGVGECPLASCSCEEGYIELLTRNAGNVTGKIFELRKGDVLQIRGPYGKGFPIEGLKGKNLVLVAGGTGIAPITSFINYLEQNRGEFGEVYIYFGFHDEGHILLGERIKKWQKKFKVFVGLSSDPDTVKYEKGFIDEIVEKHGMVYENTSALLCGPEGMMKAVSEELNNEGILNKEIYWSMERRMECAFGSCGRCQIQDLYVCKDGPVFRYDVIKERIENEAFGSEVGKC